MTGLQNIHIGTSGWHYLHWRGPFYPDKLAPGDFLSFYVTHFVTVEINNSFYRLPTPATLLRWRDAAPPGFRFAVKASRFLTHMKKLAEAETALALFLERVRLLGDKLGPVLFQLPPGWGFNGERLRAFLRALPREGRFTFEFRDPSWLCPETSELLAEHRAAFCIYDFAGRQSPLEVTADFVYLRLHGPGGAYRGSYTNQALAAWAEEIRGWIQSGKEVFCYFDNDEAGFAVRNALSLVEMLRGDILASPG